MKIKRSVLEKIVREELALVAKNLAEAPDLDDAQADNKKKEAPPKKDPKASEKPKDSKVPAKQEPKKDKVPTKQPSAEDPADNELDKDAAEDDGVEKASEVTGGKIADEVQGKRIQSITMEPKSKVLPGAQEIVVQFDEIPDPLRILVNKSGVVKFYFKGIHNEL
jgi:hypothetical protein